MRNLNIAQALSYNAVIGDFVFYRWTAAFKELSVNINFYLHKEA